MKHGAIVVGGGFAGVTAAREIALRGRSVLLLEARDRLGGRTWSADWDGIPIEYGGAWVHWHQPHTWSEITRAGLRVEVSADAQRAHWWVGHERREGTIAERDAIAERGWNRFVDGVREALPNPHDPLLALDELARFDRLTIAERLEQIELDYEERAVLEAELESLASGSLDEVGAVSVLRTHALSGYSLALAQYWVAGSRSQTAPGRCSRRSSRPRRSRCASRRRWRPFAPTAAGSRSRPARGPSTRRQLRSWPSRSTSWARSSSSPPCRRASRRRSHSGRGHAGPRSSSAPAEPGLRENAIRPGHPFGYLDTEVLFEDGTQLQIGFGIDAGRCDASDVAGVQRALDEILPGYELVAATAHDWLADEYARGTWATHRPGWYTRHHAEMRRAEGRILLAGSDIANGWSGFIDGAIESGLETGARAAALAS